MAHDLFDPLLTACALLCPVSKAPSGSSTPLLSLQLGKKRSYGIGA